MPADQPVPAQPQLGEAALVLPEEQPLRQAGKPQQVTCPLCRSAAPWPSTTCPTRRCTGPLASATPTSNSCAKARYDFTKNIEKTPAPDSYKIHGDVEQNRNKNKGFPFGVSRDVGLHSHARKWLLLESWGACTNPRPGQANTTSPAP